MIDLSALDEPIAAEKVFVSDGKPMELPLADIEEDANQPRTEFDQVALDELTASIASRGVKQPISVRQHPDKAGKWIINFGARRYRASLAAGKNTIPAFVDEASDDYDQVIENEIRHNLKPMDLAVFIQRKITEGTNKGDVAKHLSKSPATITFLLSMIDMPACIEAVYRAGRCDSPVILYSLRGLYEKAPEQVEAWCASGAEITKRSVDNFGDLIKNPPPVNTEPAKPAPESFSNEEKAGLFNEDIVDTGAVGNDIESVKVTELPYHNPDIERQAKEPSIPDPNKIKKPLLLVEYKGRAAMVLLNRRPSNAGLLWIKYEDGSGEDEVAVGKCKINLLTEASA